MIMTLSPNGRLCSVVPHGVLFRGGQEGKIRKQMLEEDLIEAVIGLPSNYSLEQIFLEHLLIINKNKASERKTKSIIFINCELEFQEGKTK